MLSFKKIQESLVDSFLSWGWLSPAFFPVLEAIGRSPLQICLAIYLAWGLIVLFKRGFAAERRTVALYFLLVVVFGLSLINAVSLYKGAYTWIKYSFLILTYFMTCHALSAGRDSWKRQYRCLAIAGLLTVIVLLIRGGIMSDWHHLVPVRGMFERNLPFLLPFMLFALKAIPYKYLRQLSLIVCGAIITLVIVYSGGRSALLGLVVSLLVYGALGLRLKLRNVLLICLVVLLGTAILGGPQGVKMTRGLSTNSAIDLDSLSTGRTALWRQAIEHPPANQLIGVGMNNVRFYDEVVFIKDVAGMGDQKVKGLHNFVFDLWYETGFLGLFVYLLVMASFIAPVICNWTRFSAEKKARAAPLLSAIFAIFAAACLSFSYFSTQMAVYLFYLLAALRELKSDDLI